MSNMPEFNENMPGNDVDCVARACLVRTGISLFDKGGVILIEWTYRIFLVIKNQEASIF